MDIYGAATGADKIITSPLVLTYSCAHHPARETT